MNKQEEIIAEIRRVAHELGMEHLRKKDFATSSRISSSKVRNVFGSWNRAVQAAGLQPITGYVPEHKEISEEELMTEVLRLTKELGKVPSGSEMNAYGKYSERPYRKRWGTYARGRSIAYQKLGLPELGEEITNAASPKPLITVQTIKPKQPNQRKKVQFGESIDFRGLRFAPINEQGVVYLFGMVSRELGFLIESVRTEYPDCEGKRCIDKNENRWEHVLLEFEQRSSHFQEHGHSPDNCDLIVCWIHDWPECPIEVLELRSTIKYLRR